MVYGNKEIIAFYMEQYTLNMVYNTEYAYTLLDEQYKKSRFPTYEDFSNYVENQKEYIEKSIIMKYEINEKNGYKEYVCLDYNRNYYIFKETDIMKYTVLLDRYTVQDTTEINKYKSAKDEVKVQMDLNKFEQMINRKDYNSAYNVLNENFRNKYFNSINAFKEYVSNNFYIFNEFMYEEQTKEDEGFKIKTEIKNLLKNEDTTVKRFKVTLLDGNKFDISFDI